MAVIKLGTKPSKRKASFGKMHKAIKEIFESEEHKFTTPKNMVFGLDDNDRLLAYIIGNEYVVIDTLPIEVLAKIAVVVFYHARMACGHRIFVRKTIDEALLNHPTSNKVTPKGAAKMPKGLSPESKFYFEFANKHLDDDSVFAVRSKNAHSDSGEKIVVTEDGVYLWTYSYRRTPRMAEKFKKSLRSKVRFLPTECSFVKLDSKGFAELFGNNSRFALNLFHRVKETVIHEENDANRALNAITTEMDNLHKILGVIYWR
jgi:hypothetical protein